MCCGPVMGFSSDAHLSLVFSTNLECRYLLLNQGEPRSKVGKICHTGRGPSDSWKSKSGFWFYVKAPLEIALEWYEPREGRAFV